MAILLSKTDFIGGKYDIPDASGAYTKNDVQEAIDKYEKKYIYLLIGVTEGDRIIAYLAASRLPANTDYNKILDPFNEDSDCGIVTSAGMEEYLKACIFYEYIKNGLKTSQAGVVKSDSETAIVQTPAGTMRFAESKFNDILDTIEAIQWYCLNNQSAFPDFNGQRIPVKASNIL